jgi:predicted short-subunit dehydrogenase-like oxidoreductase (DUF2520 family)
VKGVRTAAMARRPSARVAVVGAGTVATAVAVLLQRRGHEITGIWSRSPATLERARRSLPSPAFDLDAGLPEAEVVLIGATDGAVEALALRIAPHVAPGAIVCHFAGALGIAPLGAVASSGGVPCALHPVQACPDVATALRRLPGSAWGVTCGPDVQPWATSLVRDDLGGLPVVVAEGDRALWHAAAATTANGTSAVLALGEALLAALGAADPTAVLNPLAAGVVDNAREAGGGAATLTGPIARGDTATVALHLAALERTAPELRAAYALVARAVLEAARRAGRVDAHQAESIGALLGSA